MKRSRKDKKRFLLLGCLVATSTASFGLGMQRETSPNFLVILCDDLGYGDIGIHGNTVVETPNIDRLGRQSVQFSNFYAAPVCAPTRASLMTGRYYHRTGVYGVFDAEEYLDVSETTGAELLKQNGYVTGMSGKWHLGDCAPYDPASRGFDSVLTTGNYYEHENPTFVLPSGERTKSVQGWTSDLLTDHAISFITENKDRPFFYYLAFPQTHNPWNCPDSYQQKYLSRGFSPSLSLFYGMLDQTDVNIGRIFQTLEKLRLDEKTIVIFASDNGPIERPSHPGFKNLTEEDWALRNPDGLKGKKAQIWENGVRVPLFIRWKNHLQPATVTSAAHVVDLFPTMMDFSNVTVPSGNLPVDGISLRPLLEGRPDARPDRMLFNISLAAVPKNIVKGTTQLDDKDQLVYADQKCAVWKGMYKFVHFRQDMTLYNIYEDPAETSDISAQHPELFQQLNHAAENWFAGLKNEPHSFRKPVFFIMPEKVDRIRMPGAAAFVLYGGTQLNNGPIKVMQGKDLLRVAGMNGTGNWSVVGDGAGYRIDAGNGGTYDVILEGVFPVMDGDLTVSAGTQSETRTIVAGSKMVFHDFKFSPGAQEFRVELSRSGAPSVKPFEVNAVIFQRSPATSREKNSLR